MATIRESGYHHWDGALVERRRPWWPITRTGIQLTFRKKRFKFLFSTAFIPAFIFLAGIYVSERLDDFRFMIQGSDKLVNINPAFFKIYFTLGPLLFMIVLLLVFAGAGLIADDLKYNALQLYFARPLGKRDYLLGKAAVPAFFVLILTLVPGLLLFVFKLLFAGNLDFFRAYPWLPLSIIAASLVLTAFFACYAMLLSSLSKNRRYVAVMTFAVYLFSDILAAILQGIFRSPYFGLFSIRGSLQQAGAALFREKPPLAVSPAWAFAVLAVFCLVAVLIVSRRVRGAEVVK